MKDGGVQKVEIVFLLLLLFVRPSERSRFHEP
jgi:hypothetical protein